jgi:hypothetical protein
MKKSAENRETSVIYTASGGRLVYYFLNVGTLIALTYLITRYNENPKVISIIIGLLVLWILPVNMVEYFFAENDRLIILYKRVFFLQFLNRKRVFKFNEIKQVSATLKIDMKTDVEAFLINLTSKFMVMATSPIVIEMKNGKKKYINTRVYKHELLPILDFMKSKGVDVRITFPNEKDLF